MIPIMLKKQRFEGKIIDILIEGKVFGTNVETK